jgi:hypothetical protein
MYIEVLGPLILIYEVASELTLFLRSHIQGEIWHPTLSQSIDVLPREILRILIAILFNLGVIG